MFNFDYANARIRAMKSRLLKQADIDALVRIETIQGLISAMTKTDYQNDVETALSQYTGVEAVLFALRSNTIRTFKKTRSFFNREVGPAVAWILRRYDIHNIKTLLRGISTHSTASEIKSALLPVGDLDDQILNELIKSANPHEVIDKLATLGLPYAAPLVKARLDHPASGINFLETALEKWYFTQSRAILDETGKAEYESFRRMLDMDSDFSNFMTVLRFFQNTGEMGMGQRHPPRGDLEQWLVSPGKVPIPLLKSAAEKANINDSINVFSKTTYCDVLLDGIVHYKETGRLSSIENNLLEARLYCYSRMLNEDPLGSGVLIGYTALKVNETNNLRWITYGISNNLKPDTILSEMVQLL